MCVYTHSIPNHPNHNAGCPDYCALLPTIAQAQYIVKYFTNFRPIPHPIRPNTLPKEFPGFPVIPVIPLDGYITYAIFIYVRGSGEPLDHATIMQLARRKTMCLVSRDPFARQELHRETHPVPANHGGCNFCGQLRQSRRGTTSLFKYSVESDTGRTHWIDGLYCSVSCLRAYAGI